MFVFGLLLPFALLFIQGASPKIRSIRLTVCATVLINVSMWVARALVVLPTFYHPLLPWWMAPYSPTLPECGMVIGSFFFGLLLLVMIKILPVLELPERDLEESHASTGPMPVWKMALVCSPAAGGVFLIALGISLRGSMETYHSPGIWISGIALLVTVPLQICVLPKPSMRGPAAQESSALAELQTTHM